jgi:hypothetical protein
MYFLVSRKNKFLCFDLENEEWNREIKYPWTSLDVRLSDINIVELNGALCIAQMKVNTTDQALFTDIWLLTDSENGVWCKTYTIQKAPFVHVMTPLRILRDSRKLIFCYVHKGEGRSQVVSLHVYDPCVKTCTGVPIGLTNMVGVCDLRLERFISASS